MRISELNRYLSKLEGPGLIQRLDTDNDTLELKFCGNTGGPYDDGEIKLSFHDIEVINLPVSIILPAQVEQATEEKCKDIIGINYQWDKRNLYLIRDDVGHTWHIYAGSFSVSMLPVFWKRT